MSSSEAEDLRPSGTVTKACAICKGDSWHDPISQEAAAILYVCSSCLTNEVVNFLCSGCHRSAQKPSKALQSRSAHAKHCERCERDEVPEGGLATASACREPDCGESGVIEAMFSPMFGSGERFRLCARHASDCTYVVDGVN